MLYQTYKLPQYLTKIMIKKNVPFTSLPHGIYTLKDNGLRCFVSPCFSWDVLNNNGQLIAKVSDVDFSRLQDSSTEIEVLLVNEGLRVIGYAVPLPESDGVHQAVRFIVERLEGNYLHRQ